MKKLILAIATLSCLSTSAYAVCNLKVIYAPNVGKVVNQNGGWPISDENCALLNKNNMALAITGAATVLSNTSIGWANAQVSTRDTNIVSDKNSATTTANSTHVSVVTADQLMYDSIRAAIDGLDFNAAIKEVKQYQAIMTR